MGERPEERRRRDAGIGFVDDTDYLDPLIVQDSWFEIALPSLLHFTTDRVPAAYRALAKKTALWLNSETLIEIRQAWYVQYTTHRISLEQLEYFAPLIASAIGRSKTKPKARTPRR